MGAKDNWPSVGLFVLTHQFKHSMSLKEYHILLFCVCVCVLLFMQLFCCQKNKKKKQLSASFLFHEGCHKQLFNRFDFDAHGWHRCVTLVLPWRVREGRQIPTDSYTDGTDLLHSTVECVPLKGKEEDYVLCVHMDEEQGVEYSEFWRSWRPQTKSNYIYSYNLMNCIWKCFHSISTTFPKLQKIEEVYIYTWRKLTVSILIYLNVSCSTGTGPLEVNKKLHIFKKIILIFYIFYCIFNLKFILHFILII